MRHVRRGRIRGLHTLGSGQAEVIEMQAMATSGIVGKPLRDLHLPAGVLIGAIIRDGTTLLPRAHTVIQPDDRVVIFARGDVVRTVKPLFPVGLGFFWGLEPGGSSPY